MVRRSVVVVASRAAGGIDTRPTTTIPNMARSDPSNLLVLFHLLKTVLISTERNVSEKRHSLS